jgi:Helix-turn-helix domain
MSDLAYGRVLHTDGCTLAHVRVFHALHDHAYRCNPKDPRYGWAWPSIPTLAAAADLSRQQVITSLKWLERNGLVAVVRVRVGPRRNLPNRYWLSAGPMPKPPEVQAEEVVNGAVLPRPGGSQLALTGSNSTNLELTEISAISVDPKENISAHAEKNGNGSANGNGHPGSTTWLTPFLETWRDAYGGDLSPKANARYFAEVRRAVGQEEAEARWLGYIAVNADPRFASVKKFSETHGSYRAPPTEKYILPEAPPLTAEQVARLRAANPGGTYR